MIIEQFKLSIINLSLLPQTIDYKTRLKIWKLKLLLMHNQSCSSLQKNMRDCVVTIIRHPQEKGKIVPDLLTKMHFTKPNLSEL